MLEDWIVVTVGVIVVAAVVSVSYVIGKNREIKLIRDRQKLKAYEELFHAITSINVAGSDPEKLVRAKMHLALTLNKLNLLASPEVLKNVNLLLDFLNECTDNNFDILKQMNILNTIVRAVRMDLDPKTAREFEDLQFRFKFYSPKR
ncbi:MAG: hypothetical protein LUQ25_08640 [Methanoregulaceae archaeon]|nr:hypothetical protein [Methanoregulaceae archaeon]